MLFKRILCGLAFLLLVQPQLTYSISDSWKKVAVIGALGITAYGLYKMRHWLFAPSTQASNPIDYQRNNELLLPDDLKEHAHQKNVELHHLRVITQEGSTCGFHAVINAKAIQHLVECNQAITSDNVQQKAMRYLARSASDYNLSTQENLTDDQIEQLMDHPLVKLNNGHILHNRKSLDERGMKHVVSNIHCAGISQVTSYVPSQVAEAQLFQDAMAQIRNQQNVIMHLICNLDDSHWVTVSVIKQNGITKIYYGDSLNSQITSATKNLEVTSFWDRLVNWLPSRNASKLQYLSTIISSL